ncbi:hypothetical protein Tco_1284774 [Tanacetum coccineum]
MIDVVKNSTSYKTFTISADVPEIFMQQFWYTIKNVPGTNSSEFMLSNKKCLVDVEVFRKILDICPRVEGEDFTEVQDDDATLTFLIDIGYKGLLHKYTNMYVDHMHQPGRTLAAIINKYLSGKTVSNDTLRKSKIDILWGMFYRENVDYPELIWEDFVYQIDNMKEKKSRKKTCHFPDSPKLKFVRIGEIYQEYGLAIPEMMLNDEINKGKGSQGKKDADDSQDTVDLSKESEPKPEPAKKTGSRKQEAAVTMQAIKNSKKTLKSLPTTGSNEGTNTGEHSKDDQPKLDDEEKNDDNDADDEKDDINDAETESDEEDIYKYKIHVYKGVDEEMKDVDTVEFRNDEGEMNVAEDAGIEKIAEETIDDVSAGNAMATDLQTKETTIVPLQTSSQSVSSGFGTQFLNLSFDISLTGILKDSADAEISSLMDETTTLTPIIEIPTETPVTTSPPPPPSISTLVCVQQTLAPILTLPIITEALPITTAVSESNALNALQLRVAELEKEVSELKKSDISKEVLASLKSQVPQVVNDFIESRLGNILQNEFLNNTTDMMKQYNIKKEQAKKQKMPKYTIKSTNTVTLKDFDHKSSLYQTMHNNKTFNRNPANHALYHALMKALIADEDAMDKGVADTVKYHKRQHDDDDDDEEGPSAGSNQGKRTKRRRTTESESSKKQSTTKESPKGKASSKGSKTGKSATTKVPVEEPIAKVVMDDMENTINEDVLDGNNPEGDKCTFDFTKPFLIQGRPGHSTVAADYFFNNDIEFLKSSDPKKSYITSITKTKAARYNLKGIEDMIPKQWSKSVVGYDKDAEHGIKHLDYQRKLWYRSQNNIQSKHDVYSTQKILSVVSVKVNKLHGYGYLEEIVVRRADKQKYKFKEGEFVNLHLNDIEDMLLLAVQHKLFQLEGDQIVDFITAMRMFTRSLIIKRRVEDVQLGVESYQKKLNLIRPQKTYPGIEAKELFTPSVPPGIINEDKNGKKGIMWAVELHKFSYGMLKFVHDKLHHRVLDFKLDYNFGMPKRKWTTTDQRRSSLMVELMDKQLREKGDYQKPGEIDITFSSSKQVGIRAVAFENLAKKTWIKTQVHIGGIKSAYAQTIVICMIFEDEEWTQYIQMLTMIYWSTHREWKHCSAKPILMEEMLYEMLILLPLLKKKTQMRLE